MLTSHILVTLLHLVIEMEKSNTKGFNSSNETFFEIVTVKKEAVDEPDLLISEVDMFNLCEANLKEEVKLEETLILDDDMTCTDNLYECQHCNIAFNQLNYLRKHEKSHEDIKIKEHFPCPKCIKSFTSFSKLKKHLIVHNDKCANNCLLCNKSCKSISALKIHQGTHLRKPPTCEVCGKSFSETYNLVVHMRIHSGSKPYSCETCGKSFVTNSSLTVHRRIHSGERPYECTVCHKCYTTSSYLNEHSRIHQNDTPYHCSICPKKFKTARHLKNHQYTHNPLSELIECEKCGKMLKSSSSKRNHDKTSCPKKRIVADPNELVKDIDGKKVNILLCKVCRKEFTGKHRRTNMHRHMRLHTKYRPYSCDQCDKKYSDWTAWKSHTRSHTSEKPYHCKDCNLYFKSPNNLSRHYLNIHKLGKKTTLKPGNKL